MRTRTVSIAISAGLLVGGLTACSPQHNSPVDCVSPLQSGALSSNVAVNSQFGEEPRVSIPTDIVVNGPQVVTVQSGEDRSEAVDDAAIVGINYVLYNGATGEAVERSADFESGKPSDFIPVRPGQDEATLPLSLACTAPGDRIVTVLSPEESLMFLGDSAAALVAIIDVHSVGEFRASGKSTTLPTGFPGVVTDHTGRPGVVIAPGAAPSETKSAQSIIGTGDEVTASEAVIGHVLTVSWEGNMRSSTWSEGPQMLGFEDQPAHPVRPYLSGYEVGSQVVVLLVEDGETTVHVVDILAAS